MFSLFEKSLAPTSLPENPEPPGGLLAFYWHFARQARGLFIALFVTARWRLERYHRQCDYLVSVKRALDSILAASSAENRFPPRIKCGAGFFRKMPHSACSRRNAQYAPAAARTQSPSAYQVPSSIC